MCKSQRRPHEATADTLRSPLLLIIFNAVVQHPPHEPQGSSRICIPVDLGRRLAHFQLARWGSLSKKGTMSLIMMKISSQFGAPPPQKHQPPHGLLIPPLPVSSCPGADDSLTDGVPVPSVRLTEGAPVLSTVSTCRPSPS